MRNDSERGKYTSPDGSAMWEYVGVLGCVIMSFSSGCVTGWNSPTLGILMGQDSPVPITSSDASTLSAISSLGHAVAPVLTILMADKLGRKNSLLISNIPSIISWAMIIISQNIMVLFAARFIGGLAFGLNMCIPPMYLGEIASANFRGAIGVIGGITMTAGMLFMFTMVPYLSVTTTACICASIATAATISVWFIPESPYFLAMVGKFDEAEGALEKLRGKTNVADELELIKTTVSLRRNVREDLELKESSRSRNPKALTLLFTVPGNRKALGIMFLFVTALFTGSFGTVAAYGDIIFKKMNAGVGSYACTMIIGTIQLVSNIMVVFVIDKMGRRPLILVSGLVSGLCVLTVGVYFYLMEYTDVDVTPYGLFALCAIFLNMTALGIGLMPLSMVIQSEIFDTDVKALATSFVGVCGGIIGTVWIKFYLTIAETWGYGHCVPFFGFFANVWFCTALILKLLPETKGKTLFDIQRDLNA